MEKAKIMIVENEGIVVLDLRHRLRHMGYSVPAVAASGEEAIQKAIEVRPDLVLMDIRLKGAMNGIEAAEVIHTQLGIPVVYLTALGDKDTIRQATDTSGACGYIGKPFDEVELHTTIERSLGPGRKGT